jgi:hypothetical protein
VKKNNDSEGEQAALAKLAQAEAALSKAEAALSKAEAVKEAAVLLLKTVPTPLVAITFAPKYSSLICSACFILSAHEAARSHSRSHPQAQQQARSKHSIQ